MAEVKPETNYVAFRAAPDLLVQLVQRAQGRGETPDTSTGIAARADLTRYYQVLADELRRLDLAEPEASAIVDASNGTTFEPWSYSLLWANVADAVRLEGLAAKWGVDGPALVAKLRALSPGATLAAVDAAERFWRLVGAGDSRPTGEILRAVGLVRDRK